MPRVSVIMSVYKEPLEWIRESIDSILNQTFRNFEFIIVNDNPQGEEQIELLRYYKTNDSRIVILYNEENIGLARSLNKAIMASRGEYIARMDADDIALPERFKMQVDYLDANSDVAVCGTWGERFGELPKLSYRKYQMPVSPEQVRVFSLFASPMIHPTIMGRSSILKRNLYNAELRKAQDYELWERLLLHNDVLCNIPLYLIKYRETKKSQTKDSLLKQERVAEIVRRQLLSSLGGRLSEKEFSLHNDICFNRICSLLDAEQWLLKLRSTLLASYPDEEKYIYNLIGSRWAAVCLNNNVAYSVYRKSNLYWSFSWITILRYLKRRWL